MTMSATGVHAERSYGDFVADRAKSTDVDLLTPACRHGAGAGRFEPTSLVQRKGCTVGASCLGGCDWGRFGAEGTGTYLDGPRGC